MKKLFALIAVVFFAAAVAPEANAQSADRNDVMLNLAQLDHPAVKKMYKKASPQNQLENLTALVREAEKAYYDCKTIDDLYRLDIQMDALEELMAISKDDFIQVKTDIKLLRRKLSKSIYDQDKNEYDRFR